MLAMAIPPPMMGRSVRYTFRGSTSFWISLFNTHVTTGSEAFTMCANKTGASGT